MTYRPTILNISTGISLTGILIYTMWNYDILSSDGGWGIVAMFGLAVVGVTAGLIDLILQQFIKSKTALNIIELLIILGLAIAIL